MRGEIDEVESIEALKKRLNEDKLLVQQEEGYLVEMVFKFNAPALKDELAKLPPYVPTEILEFLAQHNGADLFYDPKNGGETHLFSVGEILEHIDIWECPEYFIPVGYHMPYVEMMVVNDDAFDWTARYWYYRNLRITQLLRRTWLPDTERALLLIGAGHSYLVRQQLLEDPRYEVITYDEWMAQKSIQSKSL